MFVSAVPHDKGENQFVEFLEAVYALDRSDDEWLTQALSALAGLCGSEHHYSGFFYDASNVADLKVWNRCRLRDLPPELAASWRIVESIANPSFVRATFRSLLVGSGRRSAQSYVQPVLAERERNGHGDFYYLNGLDSSGLGCVLSFGCKQPEFTPQPRVAALLRSMATHLSAAYRCRRKLIAAGASAPEAEQRGWGAGGAEAVVEPSGRIVHAEGAAKSKTARESISGAAAAIESARHKPSQLTDLEAMGSWHPLVGARWTLVDSFEEGGRRYVVARENQADLHGFTTLTDRERQVVVHAALGLTNKEIAYTLGISHVTVRVLLARAARRLGVRSRTELLAHSTLSDIRPAEMA